ncbi:MAG: hypothetical protein JNJ45_12010 [Chthonomonas sp.]|nr:hypothetical protein [Chthonomonas sp.]
MSSTVTIMATIRRPHSPRAAFDVRGMFAFEPGQEVGSATLVEALERIAVPLHALGLRKSYPRIVQALAAEFPGMTRGELLIRRYHPVLPFWKERVSSTFQRPTA